AHIGEELIGEPAGEFGLDETSHQQRLRQYVAHERTRAVGTLGQFGEVVVGHESAHGHASEGVQPRQHGVEDLPADVLVIDVDASGHRLLQLLPQVARPVVQGDVEAEFTQVGDLVRAAGDADGGRSLDLRDLTDDGADGTGGGG